MILFKRNILYVWFDADTISVRASHSGQVHTERAALALSAENTVVAVGESAAQAVALSPSLRICTPFAHPRMPVSNTPAAAALLRYCIAHLQRPRLQLLKPHIIIHPLRAALDDLTDLDLLSYIDLAQSAGARSAHVWVGRPLGEEEQRLLQFPASAGRAFDRDTAQRFVAER
ncbi:hypothetical protein F8S13_05355 [Chloroflexia bacterium SDU3-3]|nr:hypothetical protein F8S13_05355 [Chloroflexia bacterium SDU3-3]